MDRIYKIRGPYSSPLAFLIDFSESEGSVVDLKSEQAEKDPIVTRLTEARLQRGFLLYSQ